jgi:acetoin utilization deacetylase AcuC-like enzyme
MMELLFDRRVLRHNPLSAEEGAWRLDEISKKVQNTPVEIDGEEYLELVHSAEYIAAVKDASRNSLRFAYMQNDPTSYDCASLAVAMAVKASEEGLFSLARPPGHHASQNVGDGYCLFNNVAIAARKLVNLGAKVAILDFDAHHGDGTQRTFLGEPQIKYFSIHENNCWPFSGEKGWQQNCFNYPVDPRSEDRILVEWGKIVQEKVSLFGPDYIAISAGFDGLNEDRVSNLDFSVEGYRSLGSLLGKLETKTFAVLEGGYHEKVYDCVVGFSEGFNAA